MTPLALPCQAPLSMGFPRQEYWSGLPASSSRESSLPRDPLLHWQADSLPLSHQGSPGRAVAVVKGCWANEHRNGWVNYKIDAVSQNLDQVDSADGSMLEVNTRVTPFNSCPPSPSFQRKRREDQTRSLQWQGESPDTQIMEAPPHCQEDARPRLQGCPWHCWLASGGPGTQTITTGPWYSTGSFP